MALNKEESKLYDDTRLFWVTDSPEDNEEIFETLEDAEEYIEATKFDGKPRIRICAVRNTYKTDRDEWVYDDFADTFETIKIYKEYK